MSLLSSSPFEIIKNTIANEFMNDAYFSEMVYNTVVFASTSGVTRPRIVCMFWNVDWIVDSLYAPVVNALSIMSKIYFNVLLLPMERLRKQLASYVKNVIELLRSGLIKYACKRPPLRKLDSCPLSADDLIEYALRIIVMNPDVNMKKAVAPIVCKSCLSSSYSVLSDMSL